MIPPVLASRHVAIQQRMGDVYYDHATHGARPGDPRR